MGNQFNLDRIMKVVESTEKSVITVFGDYCLDEYVYSKPSKDELSLETGLVAYQINASASYPGIGGTITNNLRSLGANVICVGITGDDGHGYELRRSLKKIGADINLMIVTDLVMTNTYMKPMRGETMETSSEINRLDFRSFHETPSVLEDLLLINLEKAVQKSQGVIITDQYLQRNCSAITDRVRSGIADLALKYKDTLFYADSRGFISEFKNVIQKCNEHEIEKALLDKNQSEDVVRFVTMAEKGIMVYKGYDKTHIPSFKATPPFDFCGAGDATNAGIMLGLTRGLSNEEAALLGACIASITIEQIGVTGSATQKQVEKRLRENMDLFATLK